MPNRNVIPMFLTMFETLLSPRSKRLHPNATSGAWGETTRRTEYACGLHPQALLNPPSIYLPCTFSPLCKFNEGKLFGFLTRANKD